MDKHLCMLNFGWNTSWEETDGET